MTQSREGEHQSSRDPGKGIWDVVIVGTGVGGATLGYALAKAGKRVLFCEKGRSNLKSTESLRANYAETFFAKPELSQKKHGEILARAGRWSTEIESISPRGITRYIPFIGSGTGGSSALYGMAMERFSPADFIPGQHYQNGKDSTVPVAWPVTYAEFLPHYIAAEKLYRVRGEGDPLRAGEPIDHLLPLPPMTPVAEELHGFLMRKGLHPYRLPLACEFVPGCECCQGYLCARQCKNDSARVCLEPALDEPNVALLDECDVVKLEARRSEVTGVLCVWKRRPLKVRAAIVVLAAGALETPRILLNSSSPDWPNGLANDSGLVGRNLMRHYIDLYVLKPKSRVDSALSFKEIAFNDYYVSGGEKFGTVQSFGSLPPASVLVEGMEKDLRTGSGPLVGSLFHFVKPAVRALLERIFSQRIILASIMEDLPYENNMVDLSEEKDAFDRRGIVVRYRIREQERLRIEALRKKISELLKPYSFTLIRQSENNERIAHACGTCRFGTDPERSVLDPYNRAHGISNLYAVDSSFFPSSAGTNPALTIAANALRVADYLVSL